MCRGGLGGETGAAAGHYGRTQEPHSQRLIMGPRLTTTYSPTSPPIFSSDSRPALCKWVSASVQMCAGTPRKKQWVCG